MQAQGGAAEREESALHFLLGKTGIAGAQVDVGGQHQFDARGQAVALRRDNHRFADPGAAEHAPGIAATGRCLPAFGQGCAGADQVEPGSEMLAMAEHHRDPRLTVGFEFAIGQAERIEQVEVEGIALGHPIQADHQDMTVSFTGYTTGAGLIHGAFPRAGRGRQTKGLRRKGEPF